MTDLARRLLSRVRLGPDGCWIWQGATSNGYGRISVGGRLLRTHRLAFELFVGPIPVDHQVGHICHDRNGSCPGGVDCIHRRCCNWEHLEAQTPAENIRASRKRRDSPKAAS